MRGGDHLRAPKMADGVRLSPIHQTLLLISDVDKHTSAHLFHRPLIKETLASRWDVPARQYVEESTSGLRPIPICAELMGARHVEERHETHGLGDCAR